MTVRVATLRLTEEELWNTLTHQLQNRRFGRHDELSALRPCPAEGCAACDRCDWVRAPDTETAEGKASDAVAVMLSVVPGLGHVYKGYKMLGLLFVIGAFGAILLGALAATATAGSGSP